MSIKALDKQLAQVGKPRQSRPGESPQGGGRGPRGSGDHVDAINQMFAEFELAYHNQFHKAYAREGSEALAKKYWLGCLAAYPPALLLKATRQVVTQQEFLPSLSTIVQACENAHALFGLPETHAAYVEACRAPSPKEAQAWSHPAVFLAGKATGWFELASEPEGRILPRFEYHYQRLCRRVMAGETLEMDAPQALEAKPARPLSLEENQARLQALREQFSLY